MAIVRAGPLDLPAIERLLSDAGLPLDGAASAFESGFVAREGGRIVGAAALERHGRTGLLRSVVVAPGHRAAGLGRDLVTHVEQLARAAGTSEIYLITETATSYFPRLGYEEVPRASVPGRLAESVEFTTACSSSAVVMHRQLILDNGT